MSVEERDEHTGYMTTGHEWNGITELNRPVPKVVWLVLVVTGLFSIIYWILMPAWPQIESYSKGILGTDQRIVLAEDIKAAAAERFEWMQKIESLSYEEIQADASLMHTARLTGRTLFQDNCGACHGMQAQGGDGFPRLTDDAWLWSDEPAKIEELIRVGINSDHDRTRFALMPGFGEGGILEREATLNLVTYVLSLSSKEPQGADQSEAFVAGKEIFNMLCVGCHSPDGSGNRNMGAPDLRDDFWVFGGDRESVYSSIFNGRSGHMPHWEGRLSAVQRKILTLYILDLGAAEG